MMTRRLFLALCLAMGVSSNLIALACRLGWLDSEQKDAIEQQRAEFERAARRASTIEGAILSREKIALTTASEPGVPAQTTNICYDSLVGYRTSTASSGLRQEFASTLFYAAEEGGGTAPSLVTTLSSEMQQLAYSLVQGHGRGLCCVANARTGQVYALACSQGEVEFSANDFAQNYSAYTAASGYLLPVWQDVNPPGSTAKIPTALAALLAGADLDYTDETGEYQGIRNASRRALGALDLKRAAVLSSNVYFAQLSDKISLETLVHAQELLGVNQNFLRLGKTLLPAKSTLTAASSRGESRQQAIGQGGLSVSPLLPMAWAGAAATGQLTTLAVADHFEQTLPDGSVEETPLPEGYATEQRSLDAPDALPVLQEVFEAVAESYGLALSGAHVYAKTGTAQVGEQGDMHVIYLPFSIVYPDAGSAYEAILVRENTTEMSSVLKPLAKTLLEAIDRLHTEWEG